ncbi:hypothetical protein EDD21DRAFT_18168 [Dissophora ornata]|nr:hypothetical protein EDD21DRAFT_18168 [Dissophora ornata]
MALMRSAQVFSYLAITTLFSSIANTNSGSGSRELRSLLIPPAWCASCSSSCSTSINSVISLLDCSSCWRARWRRECSCSSEARSRESRIFASAAGEAEAKAVPEIRPKDAGGAMAEVILVLGCIAVNLMKGTTSKAAGRSGWSGLLCRMGARGGEEWDFLMGWTKIASLFLLCAQRTTREETCVHRVTLAGNAITIERS